MCGCLGILSLLDGFFFRLCTILVWISTHITEDMDSPMKHETSARCCASRSVKHSSTLGDVSGMAGNKHVVAVEVVVVSS